MCLLFINQFFCLINNYDNLSNSSLINLAHIATVEFLMNWAVVKMTPKISFIFAINLQIIIDCNPTLNSDSLIENSSIPSISLQIPYTFFSTSFVGLTITSTLTNLILSLDSNGDGNLFMSILPFNVSGNRGIWT